MPVGLDMILLVLSAFLVFGVVTGIAIFAKFSLALDYGWILFLLACLVFLLVFSYTAATTPFLRPYRKDRLFLPSLLALEALPVAGAFALVRVGVLPLSAHVAPYTITLLVLVPVLVLTLRGFLKKIQKRRHNHT